MNILLSTSLIICVMKVSAVDQEEPKSYPFLAWEIVSVEMISNLLKFANGTVEANGGDERSTSFLETEQEADTYSLEKPFSWIWYEIIRKMEGILIFSQSQYLN